jgi:cell division protein FtsN
LNVGAAGTGTGANMVDENLASWGRSEPTLSATDQSARGPSSPGWAGAASDKFLWRVQVGAFSRRSGAEKRLAEIRNADLRLMDPRDADIDGAQVRGQYVNRVRFKGLTQVDAKSLSEELRRKGMEYWIIPPSSPHWQ